MVTYPEVFSRLTFETAIIIFMKKNGEIRIMLGTRNLHTVQLYYGFQGGALGGHDKRCNINNGNVAVYDLVLGEARSFNIERLVDIQYLGEIKTNEELDNAAAKFQEIKNSYEPSTEGKVTNSVFTENKISNDDINNIFA